MSYIGPAMMFLTDFADQAVMLPVVFAIAIVLAMQGWRRGALVWLGVVFVTFGVMLILKLVFLACSPLFDPIDVHSPSGHVAAATVVAGGLAALLTRRRASILPVAMLAAVVIGVSRLVLGMHSLPEVVLGALVGLAGAAALLALAGLPPYCAPAACSPWWSSSPRCSTACTCRPRRQSATPPSAPRACCRCASRSRYGRCRCRHPEVQRGSGIVPLISTPCGP